MPTLSVTACSGITRSPTTSTSPKGTAANAVSPKTTDRNGPRMTRQPVRGGRHEVFLREELQRVGDRVEEADHAEAVDRRAVGADAVLHDRRLLALDPAEDAGRAWHR